MNQPLPPPKNTDILLVTYSFILQPDGQLRSQIEHLNPDEFLKAANEANAEWEDAPTIANAIRYLLKQMQALDTDFDRYLAAM